MTTAPPVTPYRSARAAGRDGFLPLLHAEWTKFRTVRGWVIGMLVAVLVTVGVGLLGAAGSSISCRSSDGGGCDHGAARGPGGEDVIDAMTFVHTGLTGDGSVTARVTSLTGRYDLAPEPGAAPPVPGEAGSVAGLEPWAKAGVIVKDGTRQGSSYAAVAVTGAHGVRMQDDYTHDRAGLPGTVTASSPRWLRLTRSGDTLTGYDSADGTHWTRIGTAHLAGLPATVQVGLFTTSPQHVVTTHSFGGSSSDGTSSRATAAFDSLAVRGGTAGGWSDMPRGRDDPQRAGALGYRQQGGTFTLTGSGDIAPVVPGRDSAGKTVEDSLVGAFAGLVVVAVVATMFVTSEYRRGLMRTTLVAAPRRGRVLAAKALVTGAVCFGTGLVAAGVAVPLVEAVEKSKHFPLNPTPFGTDLRVVLGTAALFAATGVLALGLGTVLRRSAGAVSLVIVVVVLPYLLAVGSVLPVGPSRWLTRLTPAAAFSVQQSLHQYAQVAADYSPGNGYFPLSPWGGLAVLCGYAAAALAAAAVLLRRRDA